MFTAVFMLSIVTSFSNFVFAADDAANEARKAIRAGYTRYVPGDEACISSPLGNVSLSEQNFIKEFGDKAGIAWLDLGQPNSGDQSNQDAEPTVFGEVKTTSPWSTIKVLIIAAYLKRQGTAGAQEQNIVNALTNSDNEAIMAIKVAGGSDAEMSKTMEEILFSIGDEETDVILSEGTQGGKDTKWSFASQAKFMAALKKGKIVNQQTSDYILSKMTPAQTWGLGQIGATTYKPGWGEVGEETRQMGLVKSKDNKEYAVAFGNIKNSTSPDEATNTKLAKWFETNVLTVATTPAPTVNPGSSPAAAEQSGLIATNPALTAQERIYSLLLAKGLTPAQAVGFIVNIEAESGLPPKATAEDANKAAGNTSEVGGEFRNPDPYAPGGLGLIQWTGSRRVAIVEYANSLNKDVFDFDFQLNYLWKELTENYKKVYEDLKKATNVTEAQRIILEDFESPLQVHIDARNITQPIRGEELLLELAGISAASGSYGCNGSDSGSTTAGKYGYDLEGANKMIYYGQGDDPWGGLGYGSGTIGSSGCGITSLAMIVSTIGSKKTVPSETAKWSEANGFTNGGTSWGAWPAAAKEYNLDFEEIGSTDFDKAKQTIMEGGLVLISFGGGFFGNHYMILRKVSEDGNTFYFADPERSWGEGDKQTNTKGFTREDIVSKGPPLAMWTYKKKTTISI